MYVVSKALLYIITLLKIDEGLAITPLIKVKNRILFAPTCFNRVLVPLTQGISL
jgi:hypothetical protein